MRRFSEKLTTLHRDERGMTSLETVAILAIAAIVLAVVKEAWHKIKTWFRESVNTVVNWQGDRS